MTPLATIDWLAFLGAFHPVLLHLPIGMLTALTALEFAAWIHTRRRTPQGIWPEEARLWVGWVAWGAAASGVAAVVTGLFLAQGQKETPSVAWHQWMGIGVGSGMLLAAILHQLATWRKNTKWLLAFRGMLGVTLLVLVPTGHLGGGITHGEDFLSANAPGFLKPVLEWAPKAEKVEKPAGQKPTDAAAAASATATAFAEVVQPIMEARCVSCHGEKKKKGGLNLATIAGWQKGGENGAPFVAGKPEDSLILKRIALPLDDEEHMSPKGKSQATAEEVVALTWWIKSGASFDATLPAQAPPEVLAIAKNKPQAPVAAVDKPSETQSIKPADPAAVAALRGVQVAIQPIAQGDHRLIVDYAGAAARTADADLALLVPLAEQSAELSLARTRITDVGAAHLAKFSNLETLDLRGTAVGDAGLEALVGLKKLTIVNLSGSKVTDAGLPTLAKIPSLKKVYLWGSAATAEGVAKFRAAHPNLTVDFGDTPPAQVVVPKCVNAVCPITGKPIDPQINTDVGGKLIGFATPEAKKQFDAALVAPAQASAPAAPATTAAPPVNTLCPVSGKPVDVAFTSVFEGKTVAFCCGSCKKKFDADPVAFKDKVK